MTSNRFERIHVIINPAAGQNEPILNTLNNIFQPHDLDWEVSITRKAGDGKRLAQAAVEAGADVVAAYGGDGTVMDVANGLVGTDVPLAILPGGTGNAVASDLGIPVRLNQSAALLCKSPSRLQKLDMGKLDDQYFLLGAGNGLVARMTEDASRELKDRLGVIAYVVTTLQTLNNPKRLRFQLTLDGEEVEREGVTCLVVNIGHIAQSGLSLSATIDPTDGLLDVFVINNDLPGAGALLANIFRIEGFSAALHHWQVREVTVTTDSPQAMQIDGDAVDKRQTFTATIAPEAIQVIAPNNV